MARLKDVGRGVGEKLQRLSTPFSIFGKNHMTGVLYVNVYYLFTSLMVQLNMS